MTIRRVYVDTRLGQTHVRIATPRNADARPILCVHPQPLSGRAMEPLLAGLGQRRLAVAPDLPGFGMSDTPQAPPSLEDYLGWLMDVAAATGLAQYDALGWLTGTRLVVPLAAQQPGSVRNVVLIGAAVFTADQRAKAAATPVPQPERDGSHLTAAWRSWMAWWPDEGPLLAPSDLFPDNLQGFGHPERAWIVAVTHGIHHEDYLPGLAQPVLVINPAGPMHEATARVEPYLRNGRIVSSDRSMFPLLSAEHAHEACRLVTEFLDRNP